MGEIAEKTIILLPSLPGVDELCAALMIACADKDGTTIYTGRRSYPKLFHEFLQPNGVKFLAQQDINKQIELSLKLTPPDSTVKNIRWDSDLAELKIFVELEDTKKAAPAQTSSQGIESLETTSITARQVGFDHILSFASTAEEIEDYPLLRDSGRLFGGKLIKLSDGNPITASYNYLMSITTENQNMLNAESTKYYEIGQKYYNSYRSSGSSLYTSTQGQLHKTSDKQIRILMDFWSGKLELSDEEQIWELFALIMLTPNFNPLIQQGMGNYSALVTAPPLQLRVAKSPAKESNGEIVLQRHYHEFHLSVVKKSASSTAPVASKPLLTNTFVKEQAGNPQQQVNKKSQPKTAFTKINRPQPSIQSKQKATTPVATTVKPPVEKNLEYIPLAPAKSND